ncbi:MAG: hypothetical protein Q4C00_00845 [Bacillota bacterium]|nr:hypothetical protein [Bacillota bacterium]
MDIDDLCFRYRLEPNDIEAYMKSGIIGNESGDFSDEDLKKIGTIIILKNAGMSTEKITDFFKAGATGNKQLTLLRKFRSELLSKVHSCQKDLDKIDYMIYALQTDKAVDVHK